MKTGLAEFIAELHQTKKSGLLSIPVKGGNTMLKLFFREGDVYHATCGNVKGAECLMQVAGSEFADYIFMPEMMLNVEDGNLPPLSEILRLLNSSSRQEAAGFPSAGGPAAGKVAGPSGAVLEGFKLALIRQIGPAGGKVLARVVEQKWSASAAPTADELRRLIELLKGEIETSGDRDEFVKEATKLIS